MGLCLMIHFVLVCFVKRDSGQGEELAWISHVALLVAGVGLFLCSRLLVRAALVAILVPHGLWLFDCLTWLVADVFPLKLTCYLAEANTTDWLATAHHFYLAPLLLWLVVRFRLRAQEAPWAALAGYVTLICSSRAILPPSMNINWAFGLFPESDWPLVHRVNRLPDGFYMLLLIACMTVMLFASEYLIPGSRRSKQHALPEQKGPETAQGSSLAAMSASRTF